MSNHPCRLATFFIRSLRNENLCLKKAFQRKLKSHESSAYRRVRKINRRPPENPDSAECSDDIEADSKRMKKTALQNARL
ncbi:MAG TPA: hypothetical protein DCG12_11645 [Planctomycetaceae bacterium]|nr:hypothetical protein [Planctomycetaceae bacterium]